MPASCILTPRLYYDLTAMILLFMIRDVDIRSLAMMLQEKSPTLGYERLHMGLKSIYVQESDKNISRTKQKKRSEDL